MKMIVNLKVHCSTFLKSVLKLKLSTRSLSTGLSPLFISSCYSPFYETIEDAGNSLTTAKLFISARNVGRKCLSDESPFSCFKSNLVRINPAMLFLMKTQLILYHSIALETLYNFSFDSENIRPSVRSQIRQDRHRSTAPSFATEFSAA